LVIFLKRYRRTYILVFIIVAALVLAAGCTGTSDDTQEKEISMGYSMWSSEISSSSVLEIVYEMAGYKVEKVAADPGMLFQGLASGDIDIYPGAWLPTCHKEYMKKYEDKIEFVGKNLDGVRIGFVVPSYVEADSIEDLNAIKEKTGGKIIGIEPGSGTMQSTRQAIEEYDLDYELVASSETAMLAELKSSIDKNEWVVITGWRPHWDFMRWDLKFLDDPKNIYGGKEYIGSVARLGLKEDDSEGYAIFKRFSWTPEDMESVMYDRENGVPEREAAQKWVDNHPDQVNTWLGRA